MNNETRKLNKSETAVLNGSNDKAAQLIAARDTLIVARDIAIESKEAPESIEKMRCDVLNAEHRHERVQKIVRMSAESPTVYAMFTKMHKTPAALDTFYGRAIYVQDKVRFIVRALASGVGLTAVTRNDTTSIALRGIIAESGKVTRKDLRSLMPNAASADTQTSSALAALSHVGAIAADHPGRFSTYSVVNAELCEALAA